MANKPFHLAWFLSQGYGPKTWRGNWPGSDVARWMMPDLFIDLARGHRAGLLRLHHHRGFLDRCPTPTRARTTPTCNTPPARPSSIPPCWCPISRRRPRPGARADALDQRIPAVPAGAAGQLARSRDRGPDRLELRHQQQRRRGAELRHATSSGRMTSATTWPTSSPTSSPGCGRRGSPTPWCSTATSRCSPTAARSIRSTTRASTSGAAGRSTRRARRRAACRSARPAARRAASLRLALGRHDHHRGRRQRRGHEGLPRRRAPPRGRDRAAIPTASRCCSSPIRSSTPRWRRRASAGAC